jgi:hypothetical protein
MRIILFAIMGLLAACAPDAERAAPAQAVGDNVDVVNGLMTAFNNHDADTMREFWHGDVAWIEITGEQSRVVTSSASQLRNELVSYFEAFTTVSSSLAKISVNGDYVTAIETTVWGQDGARKSQSSIVVYEITDGKVKRFWYFSPQ